jgi:hypothetical protein
MKKMKLADWFTRPQKVKKSIHEQIAETIAERKRILPEWEKIFSPDKGEAEKDIHHQLRETIAAYKKAMKQHESFFMMDQNKKAA